jgi:hypothetical protein
MERKEFFYMRRFISLTLVTLIFIGFAPFLAPPEAEASAAMDGAGTANDPFLVATADHLGSIQNPLVPQHPLTAHYRQTANIDISAGGWIPIGSTASMFTGTYDGAGFTVSGLNFTGTESVTQLLGGLFGDIGATGVVKNLGVINVDITYIPSGTNGNTRGGIAGWNRGTIKNSYVTGSIAGRWRVGGIAGVNDGLIENCYSRVTINAADYAGGLAGTTGLSGTIRNSAALNPSITSSDTPNTRFAGRVSGNNHGTLANNFALDTMTVTMDGNAKTFTKGLNTIDGADITAAQGEARIAGISKTAEWSILWLIIPELNAAVGGTMRQSTLPAASANRLKDLADDFKEDTEREIMSLNGLDLTLRVTPVISTIPIKSVTGHYPALGYWPEVSDLAPNLDVHAPNREADFDSLIVMAQFPSELHNYGGINMGWMSFCPLPYTYNYKTGQGRHYDVQLHEWVHQMEGIGNGILERSGIGSNVPSPDDLNEQNPEYAAHLGDRLNTVGLNSFYWEILAGTLPAKPGKTGGFDIEWWKSRPTLSAPQFKVDFKDGVTATATYSYDVQVNDSFMLVYPDKTFHEITQDMISLSNDNRVITVSLGELEDGRYTLISAGYGENAITAPGSFFNPNFERSFTVGAGGGNDPPSGEAASAVIVNSTTPDAAVINLTLETITLPEEFTVAAFSTDGGTKWRRGALPAANRFPRMLNRGMTLHLTSVWDQKEKSPGEGAVTITFPEIGSRPKRNPDRLAPFYGSSNWGLAPRGSAEASAMVFAAIEYAPSANGKTPNNGIWFSLSSLQEQGGIEIASSGRATFLFRIAPTAATPASPVWRVRSANFGKAPNYKIRQVKEGDERIPSLVFRKGDQYAFGTGEEPVLTFTPPLDDKASQTVAALRTQAQAPAADAVDIYIRRASTGRRPPTLTQKISLAAPAQTPAP